MKPLGIVLLAIGLCGLLFTMPFDTAVPGRPDIEVDQYGIAQRITQTRLHNLGLMNRKQNMLIMFGALSIVGAVLTISRGGRMPS